MGLNLLEQLKESPIGKQLKSDFAKQTLEKRKAAVSEIQKITAGETKVLPGLLQAREKAEAGVKAAQQALQKAKEAYDRAHGEEHNARIRAGGRRHEQEIIMRSCYPPEIDTFKEEMDKLLRLTRAGGIQRSDHGYRSPVDSKWKSEVYSDSPAVHARIEYLRAAIAEAEGMKLKAMPIEEVAKRLKELKTRMPQVGVMQLIT